MLISAQYQDIEALDESEMAQSIRTNDPIHTEILSTYDGESNRLEHSDYNKVERLSEGL